MWLFANDDGGQAWDEDGNICDYDDTTCPARIAWFGTLRMRSSCHDYDYTTLSSNLGVRTLDTAGVREGWGVLLFVATSQPIYTSL